MRLILNRLASGKGCLPLLLALLAGWPTGAFGQPAPQSPSATKGQRQIAPVMSYRGADWLTRPERKREEHPDRLVDALEIPKGSTVVDLGAGVGYFTWRLAQRVGPHGTVVATDVQPEMLDMLRENMRRMGIENVEPVLATQADPRLPTDGATELVLLVDVYHELAYPAETMRHVLRSLRPGGRLVLVEYRKEDPSIPIHPLHKMSVAEVRGEVEPLGFEFVTVMGFLPRQHIIVFRRPEGPPQMVAPPSQRTR